MSLPNNKSKRESLRSIVNIVNEDEIAGPLEPVAKPIESITPVKKKRASRKAPSVTSKTPEAPIVPPPPLPPAQSLAPTSAPKPKKSKQEYIPDGSKSDYHKGSNVNCGRLNVAELEFRYHQVADWIARGNKKWQCKQKSKEAWDIAPRTFENYYTEAYRLLLDASDTTPEIEFLKSCAYYDSVMADESNPPDVRLAARLNKDKLTGIQRPKKLAMTDAAGDVITPISSVEVLGLTMAVNRLTAANLSDDQLKKLEEASEIYATVNRVDAVAAGAGRINQGEGAANVNGNHA